MFNHYAGRTTIFINIITPPASPGKNDYYFKDTALFGTDCRNKQTLTQDTEYAFEQTDLSRPARPNACPMSAMQKRTLSKNCARPSSAMKLSAREIVCAWKRVRVETETETQIILVVFPHKGKKGEKQLISIIYIILIKSVSDTHPLFRFTPQNNNCVTVSVSRATHFSQEYKNLKYN